MLSFEFEKELLDAIEKALQGSGVNPSWVLSHIEPVIERNCQSAQHSVKRIDDEPCLICGIPRAVHSATGHDRTIISH